MEDQIKDLNSLLYAALHKHEQERQELELKIYNLEKAQQKREGVVGQGKDAAAPKKDAVEHKETVKEQEKQTVRPGKKIVHPPLLVENGESFRVDQREALFDDLSSQLQEQTILTLLDRMAIREDREDYVSAEQFANSAIREAAELDYPPLEGKCQFRKGINFYRQRRYFEAHECFERARPAIGIFYPKTFIEKWISDTETAAQTSAVTPKSAPAPDVAPAWKQDLEAKKRLAAIAKRNNANMFYGWDTHSEDDGPSNRSGPGQGESPKFNRPRKSSRLIPSLPYAHLRKRSPDPDLAVEIPRGNQPQTFDWAYASPENNQDPQAESSRAADVSTRTPSKSLSRSDVSKQNLIRSSRTYVPFDPNVPRTLHEWLRPHEIEELLTELRRSYIQPGGVENAQELLAEQMQARGENVLRRMMARRSDAGRAREPVQEDPSNYEDDQLAEAQVIETLARMGSNSPQTRRRTAGRQTIEEQQLRRQTQVPSRQTVIEQGLPPEVQNTLRLINDPTRARRVNFPTINEREPRREERGALRVVNAAVEESPSDVATPPTAQNQQSSSVQGASRDFTRRRFPISSSADGQAPEQGSLAERQYVPSGNGRAQKLAQSQRNFTRSGILRPRNNGSRYVANRTAPTQRQSRSDNSTESHRRRDVDSGGQRNLRDLLPQNDHIMATPRNSLGPKIDFVVEGRAIISLETSLPHQIRMRSQLVGPTDHPSSRGSHFDRNPFRGRTQPAEQAVNPSSGQWFSNNPFGNFQTAERPGYRPSEETTFCRNPIGGGHHVRSTEPVAAVYFSGGTLLGRNPSSGSNYLDQSDEQASHTPIAPAFVEHDERVLYNRSRDMYRNIATQPEEHPVYRSVYRPPENILGINPFGTTQPPELSPYRPYRPPGHIVSNTQPGGQGGSLRSPEEELYEAGHNPYWRNGRRVSPGPWEATRSDSPAPINTLSGVTLVEEPTPTTPAVRQTGYFETPDSVVAPPDSADLAPVPNPFENQAPITPNEGTRERSGESLFDAVMRDIGGDPHALANQVLYDALMEQIAGDETAIDRWRQWREERLIRARAEEERAQEGVAEEEEAEPDPVNYDLGAAPWR